jgi:hypothetical protein
VLIKKVIYKPTSGSWTTAKSISGAGLSAKTNSVLNEIVKSLKAHEGKQSTGSGTKNKKHQK